MELHDVLNSEQQKVVEHTEGPLLVLAGAGSGKTRCVIFRTAYLIKVKKIKPWNILVVTFTNKAANELKDRLERTFGINSQNLWVGTFHSLCARILRSENEKIPHDANFTIYDQVDQLSVMRKIYKEIDIDKKKFNLKKVLAIISKQKNSLILPKDFFNFNEENFYTETVHKIYTRYQNVLLENNAMDFDDLLMYTVILLHENDKIQRKYEEKFKYVMIDEYQDTNYAQFKLINLVSSKHQNLCVVGDDDQAIYSWRGADIKNILNFEKDYSNVRTIKLEQNYRSPKTILDAANCLIKNNSSRHNKRLWTEIKLKNKPELMKLDNERSEAEEIVKKISKLKQKEDANYNEFVILYRTNAQSRVFENAFTRMRIKYQIIGGVNFYQRKEIKDILAYLKILNNHQDNESLLRIINFPRRGIGKVTIQKIIDFASDNEMTLYQSVLNEDLLKYLGYTAQRIKEFKHKLQKWEKESKKLAISEFVEKLISDLELDEIYDTDDPQDISRLENIKEFVAATEEFSENFKLETGEDPLLNNYLQNISLQTDLDNYNENEESVKLMTMHNAKGLEFDYVFIAGLEDGLLPHSRSIDNERQIEEERRLLYVAITRAKRKVFMSYANMRRTFNTVISTIPSRFLMEFDDDLIRKSDASSFYNIRSSRKKSKKKTTLHIKSESEKYFRIGQKISHAKFGKGVILSVNGKGKNAKLTISFSKGKLKKIIGSFVKTL